MVLGELGELHVPFRLFQGDNILLVIEIEEPLEKQQREDVGLEVDRIDGTAQDIGGLPEMP